MRNLKIWNKVKRFGMKNSGHILAGTAVGGLALTAFFVAKETPMFQEAVANADTKLDKLKAGLKSYYPAIISGMVTAGCIIGLDISSLKKVEAITEAYKSLKKTTAAISDEAEAYKKKVAEKNPELHHEVRKEIGMEQTNGMPEPVKMYCFSWNGNDIWFEETPLNVLDAEYAFNRKIREKDTASVNDLMYLFGQGRLEDGSQFGFNRDGDAQGFPAWADFRHNDKITGDGRPYTQITFYEEPYYCYLYPEDDCPPLFDFREVPEKCEGVNNEVVWGE